MYQPKAHDRASRIGRREDDVVRARLAALVEHSGEAIVAVDRDLKVTSFNPAASRLFGLAAEAALDRALVEILGAGDEAARALDGETVRFDASPGNGICVAVTMAPLLDGGEIIGAVSLSRDVTRERFAARAAKVLAAPLDRVATIEALHRLAIPDLADLCALFSLDAERLETRLEQVAAADPAVEAAFDGAAHGHAMPVRPEGPAARVLAAGGAVLLDPVPAADVRLWKELWPQLAEKLEPLDAYSAILLPIRAEEKVAGFLYLISLSRDRRYDGNDVGLARELADRVAQTFERVRLYEATLEARERFTTAFEHAPMGMALIEHTGPHNATIRAVNSALCELSGFERDELIGRDPIESLLHPDDRADAGAALGRLVADGAYQADRRYLTRGGDVVWVHVHVARVGSQVLLQVLDVTERRRAEQALRRLNEELEHRVAERTAEVEAANRELEAANQELEAFAYSAAHDLRAPLRAIDNFARAMGDGHVGELPAEAQHYVELVRRGAREMTALIDDLLAFSRVGQQAMHIELVHPGAVVSGVVEELADEIEARGVELVTDPLPAVRADPRLLALVYANLIGNSLKFTRDRHPPRIEVGYGRDAYFVRDNGIGFDPAEAERIFNVFRRLHSVEVYEGTGVGLALVKRIVERHGGAVWAEGEEGGGATVYFRLEPAAEIRPAATGARSADRR
jgi:PAS domain S-box-containing protein